jgi:predicted transcriptional regulator
VYLISKPHHKQKSPLLFSSSVPLKLARRTIKLETTISHWLFKRRNQLHIVNEILKAAKRGASKTRIMYNVNLSSKGVNVYLSFMVKNELLRKTLEDCKSVYYASEKGLTFISGYGQLMRLLQ